MKKRDRLVNNRKGQAAMEFISNYGWAMLIMLLVIAALSYFGVLTPAQLAPSKCILFEGLYCRDWRVTPTKVSLVVENGMGAIVTVNSISIDTCADSAAEVLKNGEKGTFHLVDCNNGNVGDKFIKDVFVAYTTETGLSHTKKGHIVAVIEADFDLVDSAAPAISGISPADGSTITSVFVTLSANTNEAAHCQFSAAVFEYGSGTDFSNTGGTEHSYSLTLDDNTIYTYHIKCNDTSGNFNTDENEGFTTFTVDTSYVPPGGEEEGWSGESGLANQTSKRTITFTEDRGIARNNPYSFSFNPNGKAQGDCDDVIVTDLSNNEVASNIVSCSGSNAQVAVELSLAASGSKSFYVYYDDNSLVAPSYRTDGTEPIAGKIIFTGLSITYNGDPRYKSMYSAIYQWALNGGSGVIGCGSGEYCEQDGEVNQVNSYAGTSYTFNSAPATSSLVNGGRNYDLVINGFRWNSAGDHSASEYGKYLRAGGSLLFTGKDSLDIPFTTAFLPSGYNVGIAQRAVSCSEFPCSSSDTSHPIGAGSFCGNWGYSCQTMNTLDISSNSHYYKIWSTAYTNPTFAVAGLDAPYALSVSVGSEQAR